MFSTGKRNSKGVAMIWAIVFELVIISIITLLLTLVLTSTSANQMSEQMLTASADLDQIGEYYLRCLGYKQDFPKGGNETVSADNYPWMDAACISFFNHCKTVYGYTYETYSVQTDESGFLEGYKATGNLFKLVVKKGNQTKLIVAVKEKIAYNTSQQYFIIRYTGQPESSFTVVEWTNYNDSQANVKPVSNGLLKQVWRAIVGTVSDIVVKPTEYTVTLNPNGGGYTGKTYTVERGKSVTLPSATEVTTSGGVLSSWRIDDVTNTTYQPGTAYTPTANTQFNAIWYWYHGTLDANGGTFKENGVTSQTKNWSGVTTLPTPTREHYTFLGWYDSKEGGKQIGDANGIFTPQSSDDNKTFYAHWSEGFYYIVYDKGEATEGAAPENQTVYTGVASQTISDTVLYKTATATASAITFDYNGGSSGTITSETVNATVTITTKYKSTKWKCGEVTYALGADCPEKSTLTLTANTLTLTADFSANSKASESSAVGNITLPAAPTTPPDGKIFDGWYTQATGGTKIGNAGQENVNISASGTTFYAHWVNDSYTIKYEKGEATEGAAPENQTVYTGVASQTISDTVLYKTATATSTSAITFDYNGGQTGNHTSATVNATVTTTTKYRSTQWKCGSATYALGDACPEKSTLTLTDNTLTLTADFSANAKDSESSAVGNITLPAAPTTSPTGKSFNGWYTQATGGTKIGDAEEQNVDISSGTTFYAQWVTRQINVSVSGENCSVNTQNGSLTLPYGTTYTSSVSNKKITFTKPDSTTLDVGITPNTGYNVSSFSPASGTITDTASITVGTSLLTYTVTLTDGGGNKEGSATFYYKQPGDSSYTPRSLKFGSGNQGLGDITLNYGTKIYYTSGSNVSSVTNLSNNGNSPTTVTGNLTVTFTATSSSCITADTRITMADGSKKYVQDVKAGDILLVWNLETGTYDVAPVLINDAENESEYTVIYAEFSDGTTVGIVSEHGFFDIDLGKYVYLDINAEQYIGHSFVKYAENGSWDIVKLNAVTVKNETTAVYSPITYSHFCYYVNDMLSMPGGIIGFINYYKVDVEKMQYDVEAKQKDIEKYGLFDYEDFADIIPKEIYDAFNGYDLKVGMAKGILDWDYVYALINHYSEVISKQNSFEMTRVSVSVEDRK